MAEVTRRLGITLGDANGVGPEILLRAAARGSLPADAVVFGDSTALGACANKLSLTDALTKITVRDAALLQSDDLRPGRVDAAVGAASVAYVEQATRAALAGEIAGFVTLPINKEAAALRHPGFAGHTEYIAYLCGTPDVTMMLAAPTLLATHVSTHVSLRDAVSSLRQERIERVIALTWEAASRIFDAPRIAVAGLNPHAGEGGLFGSEDADLIQPAVVACRARGIRCEGPVPPDTVFYFAARKQRYDAVVCMYHDQGHIPMKLLDFENTVNVTLGLPIIRTSVDHGTAYDIAWQGKASTVSFERALQMAQRLASRPNH